MESQTDNTGNGNDFMQQYAVKQVAGNAGDYYADAPDLNYDAAAQAAIHPAQPASHGAVRRGNNYVQNDTGATAIDGASVVGSRTTNYLATDGAATAGAAGHGTSNGSGMAYGGGGALYATNGAATAGAAGHGTSNGSGMAYGGGGALYAAGGNASGGTGIGAGDAPKSSASSGRGAGTTGADNSSRHPESHPQKPTAAAHPEQRREQHPQKPPSMVDRFVRFERDLEQIPERLEHSIERGIKHLVEPFRHHHHHHHRHPSHGRQPAIKPAGPVAPRGPIAPRPDSRGPVKPVAPGPHLVPKPDARGPTPHPRGPVSPNVLPVSPNFLAGADRDSAPVEQDPNPTFYSAPGSDPRSWQPKSRPIVGALAPRTKSGMMRRALKGCHQSHTKPKTLSLRKQRPAHSHIHVHYQRRATGRPAQGCRPRQTGQADPRRQAAAMPMQGFAATGDEPINKNNMAPNPMPLSFLGGEEDDGNAGDDAANFVMAMGKMPQGLSISADKVFTFNQTGNIMFSQTVDVFDQGGKPVPKMRPMSAESVKLFQEVQVFFAALTATLDQCQIQTDANDASKVRSLTLYDYDAVHHIIASSGLFAQTSQCDMTYDDKYTGVSLSSDLLASLVGLGTGPGFEAVANQLMSALVGHSKTVEFSSGKTETNSKLSQIIFLCEELLGVPSVTVMLISIEKDEFVRNVRAGACAQYEEKEVKIKMHKEMFMWVDPASIEMYSPVILAGLDNLNETKIEAELTKRLIKVGGNEYTFVDGTGIHVPPPAPKPVQPVGPVNPVDPDKPVNPDKPVEPEH